MLYVPPSGSTDPNAPYVGKDVAAGTQGSRVPPNAVEHPQRELLALIAAAQAMGLPAPTAADLTQVLKAVRSGLLHRFPATGTPDAIVITPQPVYTALLEGMRFRFKVPGAAGATNASTTPTFAVNTLAPVTILRRDGSAPAKADITAGRVVEVEIDAGGYARLVGPATSEIGKTAATSTEVRKLTSAGAARSIQFIPGTVLSDMPAVNTRYVVAQVSFKGASYCDVSATCSMQNTSSSLARVTTAMVLSPLPSGETNNAYLGQQNNNGAQTPNTLPVFYQNLDPSVTYTATLYAQKGDPYGPIVVLDANLVVKHDGIGL